MYGSEMDYLRRSARKLKMQRVPKEEIRRIMQAEETVLDRIEIRRLRWFGHVMRMPEERWPAIIHSWISVGRRDDLDSHGRMASQRQWKKGDGGRIYPGPDTLEKRIGKVADRRINTHIYILKYIKLYISD
jgi:hypothetical protein